MKKLLCGLAGALVTLSMHGQVIAQWNFESLTLSPSVTNATSLFNVPAEVGSGTASGSHAASTTYSTPSGNGSVKSISVNTWAVGDYWQFQVSTVGFQNISLSYDQTSSNTGPGKNTLQYSTDGTTFTAFDGEYTILPNAAPNAWTSLTYNPLFTFTYDLSSITALNNASSVYFRLLDSSTTSANLGTVAPTGTDRVDNFTVGVVPEPASGLLLVLGLLGWNLIRRKS